MARSTTASLHALARLYGVQTAYYDVDRRRRAATPEVLLSVLRALGAPLVDLSDVSAALQQRRLELWQRGIEPVLVRWDGGPVDLELRLPATTIGSVDCDLQLENGERQQWSTRPEGLAERDSARIDGARYRAVGLPLPHPLPTGYHRLRLDLPGRAQESTIISAPGRVYRFLATGRPRAWGAFLPLYALHSGRSWGVGDLSDLGELIDWVAGMGGAAVGTLPLLATFLDEPSPYAPVSRLFWNELYVDPTGVPEFGTCLPARDLLSSTAMQRELSDLRAAPGLDYRRLMALKRRSLAEMARSLWARPSRRLDELQAWAAADAARSDYARFRAAGDEEARRYHLYVQWLAAEQIAGVSRRAADLGARLYLDLPLGVHPRSFDVWRWPHLFAQGASAGAPPDTFFTRGQSWGCPPLRPEASRVEGHRYFIACLRHHLQVAGLLRLDHVMGLHRLFWVPEGREARDGVYVRYPAEELYAILCLESHRHRAGIVGENLGTVPRHVDTALRRHGIQRMYVLQYEATEDGARPLRTVPRDAVASLNTHDMPPFASFWGGLDIEDRHSLGLLDAQAAAQERDARRRLREALGRYLGGQTGVDDDDTMAALRSCLAWLAGSNSPLVLVNLEDLWLETQPQNVPGTTAERPNWLRRARYRLEEMRQMPEVIEALRQVDRLRREGVGGQQRNRMNRE